MSQFTIYRDEAGKPTGCKENGGKPPLATGLLEKFPDALAAVSMISEYGDTKYPAGSWRSVPEAAYRNALIRHLRAPHEVDEESGLIHAVAAAWNALCSLQLHIDHGGDWHDPDCSLGEIAASWGPTKEPLDG